MAEVGEKGSMKVRGSDDPEDGKNHEDKDSQGKAEDQVEEKDSSTVPTLNLGRSG